MHRHERGVSKGLATAVGFTIGVLWLVMAGTALWAAARGISLDRSDWALGWGLVGILLLIAGAAALAGTWYHQNRILRGTKY